MQCRGEGQLWWAHLQILCRLGQAQGVEAAVARQAAVQPVWPRGVGQPQALVCAPAATPAVSSCTLAAGTRELGRHQAMCTPQLHSLVAPLPPLEGFGFRLGTGTDLVAFLT